MGDAARSEILLSVLIFTLIGRGGIFLCLAFGATSASAALFLGQCAACCNPFLGPLAAVQRTLVLFCMKLETSLDLCVKRRDVVAM